MRKHTLWQMAWLTSVLVLLILLVGGTAVSRADETETGDSVQFLPLIVNPTIDPEWLQYLNRFRAMSGLPLVIENAVLSEGAVFHSRYMVKNNEITHIEDSSNTWYTPEGAAAGQNGNVAVFSWTGVTDENAIDMWMTGPFHAIGIIDPALFEVGFGSYREAVGKWQMGATLDVLHGRAAIPSNVTFPLYFPTNGSEYWLTSYAGFESPDPLASCAGYDFPSGPPLILQLGGGSVTPNITASSFQDSGGELEHCVFDETNYMNSSSTGDESLGRQILNSRDAVIVMPKEPLIVGETYTVSLTHDTIVYTWDFSVVSDMSVTAVNSESFHLFWETR